MIEDLLKDIRELRNEMVQKNWGAVGDFDNGDVEYPTTTNDSFAPIMENLQASKEAAEAAASSPGGSATAAASASQLQSAAVFEAIADTIKTQGASLVKKVKGIIE